MSVGYESSYLSGENYDAGLKEIAESVKAKTLGMFPPGVPLHFICHSQGGLLAQLMLTNSAEEALLAGKYSSILDRTASVTFFDTPHSGSKVASAISAATRLIGLSSLPSRQLSELSLGNTSLAKLNAAFLDFLSIYPVSVLNLVSTNRILGISVAEAELKHSKVRTVKVPKNHSEICKPASAEDEVCFALEHHVTTTANRHFNKIGTNRTCIIHFLDHHFLKMKGVSHRESEMSANIHSDLLRTFRLALLAFDKIIVPIASLVESQIAARLFGLHQSDLFNVFSSENHKNVHDYIVDSSRRAGERYIMVPNHFEAMGLDESIRIELRTRSATPDIIEGMRNIDLDRLLHELKGIASDEWTISAIRDNWHSFESSDAAQFVIPPIFEQFVLQGRSDKGFFWTASQVISEYYFNSFLLDFDGWLVNPSGGCHHTFRYLDPRRVIDVRSVCMLTQWRTAIPGITNLPHDELVQLYYSKEREQFQYEFWKKVSASLLQ